MPRIDRRLALTTLLLLAAAAPPAGALDHGWTIDPNGSAAAFGRSAASPPLGGNDSGSRSCRSAAPLYCAVAE